MKKICLQYMADVLLMMAVMAGATSCNDELERTSDLAETIYPSSLEIVIPDNLQKYVYTENSTSVLPLLAGETVSLDYEILPEEVTATDIVWSSTNEAVAAVDQDGNVSAITGNGTSYSVISLYPAIIYGSAIGSTLQVVVWDELNEVDEVEIVADTTTIYSSERLQLSYTLSPSDATYRTVEWSSSDTAVATVDDNGWVTGVYDGDAPATVTITATSLDGKAAGTVTLTVIPSVEIEGIAFDEDEYIIEGLGYGESYSLKYTLTPSYATSALITWSSSNEDLISVDGGVVTVNTFNPIVDGNSATITATYGDISASVDVYVGQGKFWYSFADGIPTPWYTENTTGTSDGEKTTFTYLQGSTRVWLTSSNAVLFAPGDYRYLAMKVMLPLQVVANSNSQGTMLLETSLGRYQYTSSNGNNRFTVLVDSEYDSSYRPTTPMVIYFDMQSDFGGTYLSTTGTDQQITSFDFRIVDFYSDSGVRANRWDYYEFYWIYSFQTVEELKEWLMENEGYSESDFKE